MDPKLKVCLVTGVSYGLVVMILLPIILRNSQHVEEVSIEVTTLNTQEVEEEVTLLEQESEEAVILHQTDYCGPPPARVSEENGCLTFLGTVPCPTYSRLDGTIRKKCIPPYAYGHSRDPVVTYYCRTWGWSPPESKCYPDCGLSTGNNKYPWIVAIYDPDGELACTGTIITPFHVLTAVTCFGVNYNNNSLVNPEKYSIVAGKHYINIHRSHKSAQVRKIKRAIVHENHINRTTIYTYTLTKFELVLIEVDSEFLFFDDILPACLDWESFYDASDFTDGNEAVAIGWTYDKDEVIPCENQNEFNVQYWQHGTCKENLPKDFDFWTIYRTDKFCGFYTGGNRSDQTNCGVSKGVGLFFKSSPWRYYLKGVTSSFITTGNVTYIFYTKVALVHDWLKIHIRKHPNISQAFDNTMDRFQPVTTTGCRLPNHLNYGTFRLTLGRAYTVNTWVPSSTKITLSCVGSTDEAPVAVRCSLGAWIPSIDKLECKRPGSCPALQPSESEDIFCRLNGQEVNCTDPEGNTTAIIRCKPFHTIAGNKPIYKCHNGEWDQPFRPCILECGIKRVGVTTLTIGGSESIKNEYPWVVAIYKSMELICGGTVISKKYVLSAAHCFTNSKGTARNKELYTIIAGKYYRNIREVELSAQSRKVHSLHIHDDYKGKLQKFRDDIALIELDMELTPTLEVQPACVDWDNVYEDFDFVDGNKGVVTGWGYTKETSSPSTVLRKLVIPFRPKDVCMKNLPEDFSEQYLATDKICAGYKDNDMNVCTGDSGGGLYFKSADNQFYVRGIVSLTVRNDVGGCRSNKFALYTKVSKYLTWIEGITRRVL